MEDKIGFEPDSNQQKKITNLLENNNINEAKKDIDSYGDLINESSILLYFSGIISFRNNDYKNSINSYLQALKINPNFIEVANNLGLIYLFKKEYDLAKKYFLKTIEINEFFFHGHYNLGIVNFDNKNYSEAEKNFQNSLKCKKDFYLAYNALGSLYIKINKPNLAIKAYKSALEINPNSQETLINLSAALIESNLYKDSLDILEKIVSKNNSSAKLYSNLSAAYYGLHRIEDSIINAEKSLSIDPNNISALRNLATSKEAKGDKQNIEEIYQKILNLDISNGATFKEYAKNMPLKASSKITKKIEKNFNDKASFGTNRVNQAFGLFHIYDREKEYEKAYNYLLEGNQLYSELFPYNPSKDLETFKIAKKSFSKELFISLGNGGDTTEAPIFVLGMPRSGSTLIEQILDSHSKVFGVGERPILNHIISKYNIRYSELFKLSNEERERIGNDYIKSMRSLSGSNEPHIVDKVPQNFLFIGIIKLILPKAIIINTLRDPFDNCFSIFSQLFTEGQAYSFDLINIFNYYNQYKMLLDHWRNILPDFIYDIHYEDIIANGDNEIKNLLEFCKLKYESNCRNFYENKRNILTPSSSQVRKELYSSSIRKYTKYPKYEVLALKHIGI